MTTKDTATTIDRFEGTFHFLSNFYANAPFTWNNDVFKTGEHAFQAAKCAEPVEYFKVRDCATPSAAKKLGRMAKLTAGWEAKKLGVMLSVLTAKFSPVEQPEMAARLLLTGEAHLAEGNTWGDVYWGVDANTGVGQNQLGIALMIVREKLRHLSKEQSKRTGVKTKSLPPTEAYTPRYMAYARSHGLEPSAMMDADELRYPGGKMTGFICWMSARWAEFRDTLHVKADYPMGDKEHDTFDEWLRERVREMGIHKIEGTA